MDELWPKDEVATAEEKSMLVAFLAHQRDFLRRKATGITEGQARSATCPPSDLTILGIVRHLTDVERGWSQRAILGRDAPPLYFGDSHPDGDDDGDFHPPADATLVAALDAFTAMADQAAAIYDRASLDDIERSQRSFYSVRWILVHLIEEYARHLGHADLIRQAIDGQTGE